MVIILIILASLAVGCLLGSFGPELIAIYNQKKRFNAAEAAELVKQARLNEGLELRKSGPFKKRLKETLAMIKTEASENKSEINVAFFDGCLIDNEIKRALEELRFECYHRCSNNTLRISW